MQRQRLTTTTPVAVSKVTSKRNQIMLHFVAHQSNGSLFTDVCGLGLAGRRYAKPSVVVWDLTLCSLLVSSWYLYCTVQLVGETTVGGGFGTSVGTPSKCFSVHAVAKGSSGTHRCKSFISRHISVTPFETNFLQFILQCKLDDLLSLCFLVSQHLQATKATKCLAASDAELQICMTMLLVNRLHVL